MEETTTDESAPSTFGRYRVVRRLGSGNMGTVYLGRDERLGRDVAIKAIHCLPGFQGEMFRARFDNEARAVATLSNPHVVGVHDMGIEGDTPYLVMELVDGPTLRTVLADEGRLGPTDAIEVGVQIARGLSAAHERGILHRDVKPANILRDSQGTWKLADFGIAHVPDSSLTLAGQFLGSPAYAASEALQAGAFTPASDVYGLAATLYEAISGEPPYGPRGLLTPGALTSTEGPRPIRESCPALSADAAAAIMRALARDRDARPDAVQLGAQLLGPSVVATTPVALPARSNRGRNIAIAVGVATALVVGILVGSSDDPQPKPAPSTVVAHDSAAPRDGNRAAAGPRSSEAAQPLMRSAIESLPKGTDKHSQKRWKKVRDKLRKQDYNGAIRELEKLLDKSPDDTQARELLAELRAQPGTGSRDDDHRRDRDDDD